MPQLSSDVQWKHEGQAVHILTCQAGLTEATLPARGVGGSNGALTEAEIMHPPGLMLLTVTGVDYFLEVFTPHFEEMAQQNPVAHNLLTLQKLNANKGVDCECHGFGCCTFASLAAKTTR